MSGAPLAVTELLAELGRHDAGRRDRGVHRDANAVLLPAYWYGTCTVLYRTCCYIRELLGVPRVQSTAVHNFNRVTLFPVEAEVDEKYKYI